MKKFIIGAVAALALLPIAASAATIPAPYDAIFDGQTEVWGNPGENVNITVRIEVPSGEVVHAIETEFFGDGIGAVCHDVGNFEGEQIRNVSETVKLPPNTGDYGFAVNIFTADNMQEANALKGSTACTGDSDTGAYSEGDVVHVIPSGSSSSSSNNNDDASAAAPNWLAALIAQLQAQTNAILAAISAANAAPPTPPAPTVCAQFNAAQGQGTFALQSFLVAHGHMTQAEMNTGPGIYGPKTTRAVGTFRSANGCN